MTELHFTGNVRRLRLRPGDSVVIECDQHLTRMEMAEIHAQWVEEYPDNPCVILTHGLHAAAVLRHEDAA